MGATVTVRKIQGSIVIKANRAPAQLKKLDKGLTKASKGLVKNEKGAKKATKAYKRLGNQASKTAKQTSKLGGAMKFLGGAIALGAVIRGANEAIVKFAEFDQGITNVFTLLDANTFKKYGQELESGVLDTMTKFGFTAEVVNKSLFDTISAGIPAGEAIEFMGIASKLAISGVTDLDIAVDGLTSVVNAYGADNLNATQAMNIFFATQKAGKTTVAELASNIGKVAPLASALGVSFQEVGASLASITVKGVSTEETVTQLTSIFSSFTKIAPKAQKEYTRLGIVVNKTNGDLRPFDELMQEILEKTDGNRASLSKLFPNINALKGVIGITSDGLKKYGDTLKMVNEQTQSGTDVNNAFKMQQATLAQQTKRYNAEMSALAITIGGHLAPVKIALMKVMIKLIPILKKPIVFMPILIGIMSALAIALWLVVAPLLVLMLPFIKIIAVIVLVGLAIGALIQFWEPIKGFFFIWLKSIKLMFSPFIMLLDLLDNLQQKFKIFETIKGIFDGFFGGAGKKEIVLKDETASNKVRTGGADATVNDAIITKKGDVIKTHPDDNIIATKGNPGGTNITINKIIDKLVITNTGGASNTGNIVKQSILNALNELGAELQTQSAI